MTSKLFHTVVGVGIALGAMSVGCAAEPGSDSSSSASADTTTTTNPSQPANDQDRYCSGAWPTTKRGGRPGAQQACIDPKNECGAYPGGGTFSWDFCFRADAKNVCSDDQSTNVWKICKDTSDGPKWECPTGTVEGDQCADPSVETDAGMSASMAMGAQN